MISNAATSVALISLGDAAQGVAVAGTLGADGAGTLVVAEGGPVPAPYAVADASGAFTLFNVPAGSVKSTDQEDTLASVPLVTVTLPS